MSRILSGFIMSAFGLNKANRLYSEVYDSPDCTGEILKKLEISYGFVADGQQNIPKEGAAIVICNHPTGAMDGIILIDAIKKVRPDVRFMGNFLLDRIEPMRKYFIAVDPFDSRNRLTNTKGLRESLEHLNNGGLLAIFPAGEVATWQKGFRDIKDKEWEAPALKFIRRAKMPVLPLYIKAGNSTLFRLMGKINPKLRTAMLPHELFNKGGRNISIVAGTAIAPKRLEPLGEKEYDNYLRASVDYLAESSPKKRVIGPHPGKADLSGIVSRPPQEALEGELEAIKGEYMLFENSEQALFCVPTGMIPNIMTEIGRLREITFRQVGEGTMKALDMDSFDDYYHQLFLWDKSAGLLMGGYRMGFGNEIIPKYGIKGFYTDTLFRYSDEMAPVLEKSIELGRSFIAEEYQRRPNSLMMLWKGIVYTLLRHKESDSMIGPVTISGEFTSASKMIIATWLRGGYYNEKLAGYVRPVTGMKGIKTGIDLSLIKGIRQVDLIAKLVIDMEHEDRTVPVLVKKYLGLNSSVLGFNVDPDFADALDALMLVDIRNIPENTIAMLSKELTEIDVMERFRDNGKQEKP